MINVVVVSKIFMPPAFFKTVAAVDPAIRVANAAPLYVEEIRRRGQSSDFTFRLEQEMERDVKWGTQGPPEGKSFDELLSEADVCFAQHMFPKNLAARAPKLRWLQFGGVQINHMMDRDVFDEGRVTVTNARGVLASPISEHIMAMILVQAKNIARLVEQKQKHSWDRFHTIELAGSTIGIIGMGAIGTEVAVRARAFNMKVLGTRRSATKREKDVGPFEGVYPVSALREMLAQSDFVVLALPLTSESRKMIGEPELRAMKPTATIYNVGRGPIIDEPVLIRALKEGWIAGAGLDVTHTEPNPPDNELWSLPNVFISPHMAGNTEKRIDWLSKLFTDNLKRFLNGEPLKNVVTKDKGY